MTLPASGVTAKESAAGESALTRQAGTVTIRIDKTQLNNGGTLEVSGSAPAGRPVYLEIVAEKKVRANLFDNKRDKDTGQIPYIFYLTDEMPAFYKIIVPQDLKGKIEEIKKEGRQWSYSKALKDLGADSAYSDPAKIKIDKYKTSILASISGSRSPSASAPYGSSGSRRWG